MEPEPEKGLNTASATASITPEMINAVVGQLNTSIQQNVNGIGYPPQYDTHGQPVVTLRSLRDELMSRLTQMDQTAQALQGAHQREYELRMLLMQVAANISDVGEDFVTADIPIAVWARLVELRLTPSIRAGRTVTSAS